MRAGFARSIGRSLVIGLAGLVPLAAGSAAAQDLSCSRRDVEVVRVDFDGNKAFSDAQLALRVVTTPSDWFRRKLHLWGTRRCLNHDELAKDVSRLRTFYKERGFYNAAVDTLVKSVRSNAVAVIFKVDEGPPTLVDSLTISGLDSVRERDDVVRDLNLGVGKRFGLVPFLTDIDTIKARLRDVGYPHADVLQSYRVSAVRHRAEVELTVLPGAKARFGRIDVQVTPYPGKPRGEIPVSAVRHLADIDSGDPYSDRALDAARRNLYSTGAYRHVEVAAELDTTNTQRDSVIPVRLTVVEDLMREVNSEVGWATLDCFRTSAQYTDKNFLSSARQLEFSGRLSKIGFASPTKSNFTRNLCPALRADSTFSGILNYSLNATLRQPAIGGHAVATYSLYRERRSEYLAYLRTTLIGGEAALTKSVAQRTPLRLGYAVEFGRTEAQPALLCAVFSRCTVDEWNEVKRNLPLAVASVGVSRDRTNNPLDPSAGTIVRGEVRGSAPVIGSDPTLSFLKGTADGVVYQSVFGRMVLAARVRGGVITGGTTAHGAKLPPPQERLYAGGATSVRGFQQNQLGQLVYLVNEIDTTVLTDSTVIFSTPANRPLRVVPVGGNSLVVANVDLRFRDPFFPDVLQYTLFTDAGDVWTRQTGKSNFGFQHLFYTPGVGVRYFSPVGPIQLNVGYNPYGALPGVAYYESPVSATGAISPLYCVSPAPAGQSDNGVVYMKQDGAYTQLDPNATCPETYHPAVSKTPMGRIFNRITFTLSIGSDF